MVLVRVRAPTNDSMYHTMMRVGAIHALDVFDFNSVGSTTDAGDPTVSVSSERAAVSTRSYHLSFAEKHAGERSCEARCW